MTQIERDMMCFAKPYGYIYMIRNLINGKRYIGLTTKRRGFRGSFTIKSIEHEYNNHLINSVKKYGIQNFERKIIDSAKNKEDLDEKEEYYIINYNTLNKNKGYNMRHGGHNGKLSNETKEKISKALKGRKTWSKGLTKKTDERVAKISFFLKEGYRSGRLKHPFLGRKHSKESKKKMSEAKKDYVSWNKGIPCSEETKKRISEANKGRKLSKESRENISKGHIRFFFTKEFLIKEYWISKDYMKNRILNINQKSTYEIANENNCCYNTVRDKLIELNISKRTKSEANKLRWMKKRCKK